MSGRSRCAGCGAINRVDADFCTQCFRRDPFLDGQGGYSMTAPSATTGIPALAPAGVAPGYLPPPPLPISAAPAPHRGPVVWRWKHLWAFGFAAWGLPSAIERALGTDASMSTLIDRSMLISIVGYFLGALVLVALVRSEQDGDWTTLGLPRFDAREMATGALFGLLLLAAWVPIGLALNHGRFGLDPVVKLLVGGTSGAGLILVGIVVVIGAPVIEEIYFRGLLFEKLRRRSVWLAVPVTSVLFMTAHGALFIPAILLMGVGLGVMRRNKSLWFTMGAHSAWNLAVTTVAAFTLLGGAVTAGSPNDEPFSVTYPSTWEATAEARRVFGRIPDLALGSARGSFAMFSHERSPKSSAKASLAMLVDAVDRHGLTKGMEPTDIMPTDVDFSPIGAEGYEMGYMAPGDSREQPVFYTLLVVQRKGSHEALVSEFRCVRSACMDDVYEFEQMLASVRM